MTDLPTRGASGFWLPWAGALAAGAALRLYRLDAQVLLGDELHAVRAVVTTPLPEILFRYGVTDHCLPLSGLARLLLERGVRLSESAFRAPVVIAGLLLLAALPLLARPVAARGAARVFPWLLALSPGLVLYGRIARSYTPAALLALGAAAAFLAWWRGRGAVWAVAYAVLGALAVYFHLVTAPFVAAPLAFGAVALLVGRRFLRGGAPADGRRRPGWGALVLVGLGLAAGLAAFLVPGWESLSEVLAGKRGGGEIGLDTLTGALHLLAGTGNAGVAPAFWLVAALGLVRLARRDLELALFGAFPVAVQAAALGVLSPYGLGNPVILARYLLVALPVVLLWVAHGVETPRPAWTAVAATLLLGSVLATGPFVSPRFRTSSFVHHDDFLAFHRPLPSLPEDRVPAFYRRLGEEAGEEAVLELPAYPEGPNRVLQLYQDRHRREVVEATPVPALNDRRLAFRNRAVPLPAPMLASRARYLVVHRDPEAEELAVELPAGVPLAWSRRQENLSARFRTVSAALVARLTGSWGPPEVDDGTIVVWDLERVRRAAPPDGAGSE
jgi:hypothetical protein